MPFSSFRPVKPNDPPLDPFVVHTLTIRFEPRRQVCPEFITVRENKLVILLRFLIESSPWGINFNLSH